MKLNSQDLQKIADLTLDCYNQNAEDFWEGTCNHDVSQNIAAMLQNIESERLFTILDFGCGPGRDLKVFAELGHVAIGLEGAALSNSPPCESRRSRANVRQSAVDISHPSLSRGSTANWIDSI